MPGSPLKSKYHGPYKVLRNVNNNTYVIKTPDRKKSSQLVHINLLKAYHSRAPGAGYRNSNVSVNVNMISNIEETENFDMPYHEQKRNSEVLERLPYLFNHLSKNQSVKLQGVINFHLSLFSDHPGRCTLLKHDVCLLSEKTPICQAQSC